MIVAAAIAVKVVNCPDPADVVHRTLKATFGPALLGVCIHPDTEVLFHEDGPCAPLGECPSCGTDRLLTPGTACPSCGHVEPNDHEGD